MLQQVKKLSKLSLVYVIGDLATKGISFVLLPLYTHFLTPNDYAILGVTNVVEQAAHAILSLGLLSSIIHFYFKCTNDYERKRFFGAMWTFLLLVPCVLVLLISMIGPSHLKGIFRQIPFSPYVSLALWAAYLRVAFELMLPALFRARDQATYYIVFRLASFVLTALFTIWFVSYEQQGAKGALYAKVLSGLVVAIGSSLVMIRHVRPNVNWGEIRPAILYALPFVPHLLSQWALSLSDRIILERYVSLADLGIYSLAVQFGFVLKLIITAINNPLINFFRRAAESSEEFSLLPTLSTYFILVSSVLGLVIAVLAGSAIQLLTPVAYHKTSELVPWMVLAYFALGFYYPSMNILTMTVGKTRAIPFLTGASALLNIAANILFVPRYGIWAAAISNVLTYVLLAVLVYIVAQREVRINYEYNRLGKIIISMTIIYFGSRLVMKFGNSINILIGVICIILYPIVLAVLGFWTKREKQVLNGFKSKLLLRLSVF